MKFALLFTGVFFFLPVPATGTTVLSYNVWFDDISGLSGRYQQINDFISKENPDYVCLQEVTPKYLHILNRIFSEQYRIHPVDLVNQQYGNVVLTKTGDAESRILPLRSRMNRSALIVRDKFYTVVNVHLESMLTDTAIREQQISQIKHAILEVPDLILCGDFNFGDAEPENQFLSEWRDTGKDSAVATYDTEKNPWARVNKFPDEPTRRLDRILIRKENTQFKLEVKTVDFSDHYPVLLKINQ